MKIAFTAFSSCTALLAAAFLQGTASTELCLRKQRSMNGDSDVQNEGSNVAAPGEAGSVEEIANQLQEPLLPSGGQADVSDETVPPPSFRGLLFYRSIYFLNGLSASVSVIF